MLGMEKSIVYLEEEYSIFKQSFHKCSIRLGFIELGNSNSAKGFIEVCST